MAQDTPGVDLNALFRKQALWQQESGDKVSLSCVWCDGCACDVMTVRVEYHSSSQAAAARLWVVLGEWSLAVSNMIAESMADDLVPPLPLLPRAIPQAYSVLFFS